ncbi:MAG: hypothetical protein JO146_00530 [Candidatus Eremiobacteraeota bacterium]|nr:hypothetical protein [Candidatus Eremiobacteraeota bacterium]
MVWLAVGAELCALGGVAMIVRALAQREVHLGSRLLMAFLWFFVVAFFGWMGLVWFYLAACEPAKNCL